MTVLLNDVNFKKDQESLELSVLRQVNAMQKYALFNGLNPPDDLLQTIESYNDLYVSAEIDVKPIGSDQNIEESSVVVDKAANQSLLSSKGIKTQNYKILAERCLSTKLSLLG